MNFTWLAGEFAQSILPAIISALVAVGGVYATLRQSGVAARKQKTDAEQALRDDLLQLSEQQNERITKLESDVMTLRERNAELIEKNAELRELLAEERRNTSVYRADISILESQIKELQTDKVRLGNRVIELEAEIYRLRGLVEKVHGK